MTDWIIALLVLLGSVFVLLAAIGVLRFPDLYTRMHAATKAGAFGGTLLAIACGILFADLSVWFEVALMVLFFYSTMPVAAHLVALASYHTGVPFSNSTRTGSLRQFENAHKQNR